MINDNEKKVTNRKLLKGDKRFEGETFVEYKERLKLEKSLLNDYGKGVYISPEEHQQQVLQKKLDKAKNKKVIL